MTHPHACLLFLSLLLGTIVLGWWGQRVSGRRFDAQCPECLP
jgi:hypothetical protein